MASTLLIKTAANFSEHARNEEDKTSTSSFSNSPVGWFALDGEKNFKGEEQSLIKYLFEPKNLNGVNFDLNRENPGDVFKLEYMSQVDENMDPLLKWITENSSTKDGSPKKPDVQFVAKRNVFANVLELPFRSPDPLKMCAMKLRGTIYLCDFEAGVAKRDAGSLQTNQFHYTASKQGLKFQHYMLTDTPGEATDPTEPFIHDKREVRLVLEASLADRHTLMMDSKVKGLPDPECLVDLTSTKLFDVRTAQKDVYKRDKLIQWWSDGIMANLDRVYIGIRGDYGVVKKVDVLKISDMLSKACVAHTYQASRRGRGRYPRGGYNTPRPGGPSTASAIHNLCFNALDDFLTFVKKEMSGADEKSIYMFDWSAKPRDEVIRCRKLTAEESKKYQFIPDWYMDWLDSCGKKKATETPVTESSSSVVSTEKQRSMVEISKEQKVQVEE